MDIKSFAMGYSAAEGGGGEADLIDLTATSNGTYNHSGHDGYDTVTVNVANSYTASDEGKVVNNGGLVAQTSVTKTANGTYDTTTNNSVTVNVPNSYAAGDEGKVVSNGALVSQTSTTKNANGTYDTTLNNQVVVNVEPDLEDITITQNGTYTHSGKDGYDEVVVNVPQGITPSGNINITNMNQIDVTNYATAQVVDSDLVAGNIKKNVNILGVTGTYEGSGGVTEGLIFSNNYKTLDVITSSPIKYIFDATWADPLWQYDNYLKNVQVINFPVGCTAFDSTTIPQHMFSYCEQLTTINNFPWTAPTRINAYAFGNCSHLTFNSLSGLLNNNNLTTIGNYAFNTVGLWTSNESVTLGSNVTSIGDGAFQGCWNLATVYFTSTPTTMGYNPFNSCSALTDIYVPWAEGAISGAPWGATNATIHYEYTPS